MAFPEEQFAQRFPFTRTAQRLVKQSGFELQSVPEGVVRRAKEHILLCAQNKPFIQESVKSHSGLLEEEVLAFPLAKILLSLMDRQWLNERFARQLSQSTFGFLEKEERKAEALSELASELNVKMELCGKGAQGFCQMPLQEFLSVEFRDEKMKLVNRRVQKGKVILSEDEFARFLSQLVFQKTYSSLPLDTKGIPQALRQSAKELLEELEKPAFRKKGFAGMQLHGKLDPDSFPPCISDIYGRLMKHYRLSYMQRFDLATFLVGIGMGADQVIELFRNIPDFNQKLTTYHINRILGKGSSKRISCPGCSKVKEQGLCLRTYECSGIFTPISFYKRRLFGNKSE